MILSNQEWEKHTVALCAVWSCHQLLRQDHNHRYVTHGGNIFAICTDHIIDPDEIFETFPSRPPDATVRKTASGWDMSELDDLARRLGDDGFIAVGNPKDGTWREVEPKPIFDDAGNRLETFDHANQIDKLDAIAEFQKPRVQEPEEKDCEYYGCSEELRGLVPEPAQHFSENEESITAEYEKLSLEPKEFVFRHEVDGDDFLYQEWLIDKNEGSPHR